jgi:putative DNA-invertase from lambdoid prophage Rac
VKAALYLRVSTEQQDVENQRPELLAIARARGLEVLETYEETQSAAKRRPVFDRMLADARRARFQVLLVWAIDRFGRSMIGNITDVLELDRLGVQIVSVREPWLDTTADDPVRKLLIMVFSWMAEQERARLVARTRAGMDRARAAGKRIGRRRRVTPQLLEAALRMAQDERSLREMAVALKVPRATLGRALKAALSQKGGADPGGENTGNSGGGAPPAR